MSGASAIAAAVAATGSFLALAVHERGVVRLGPRPARESRGLRLHGGVWMVAVGAAFLVVAAGPALAVVCAGGSLGAWAVSRRRRKKRRADLLEQQLADAVEAVAAAMRSGESLSRSIAYASAEVDEPLASGLREVVRREALGEPLHESLERWVQEVASDDARLMGATLLLHRRTGGDLPHVLDRVARMLRERRTVAREMRALTAQARLSGAILGLLPIGFFLFLLVTSRRDIEAAFSTSIGLAAVVLGLSLQGLAFVWIRKLLRVA